MFWPAVAALSLALSGEHQMSSPDVRPRGLMLRYRPDTGPVLLRNKEELLLSKQTQNITDLSVCKSWRGCRKAPGNCSARATLGPTSEKLTSELALVTGSSPRLPAECCPAQADVGRAVT